MSRPPRRVVIVDDSPTMRHILSSYLDGDDRLEVVQVLPDAESLVASVAAACPDVVVLDNQMPGRDGVDILPALRTTCPQARLVMFSTDDDAVAELALRRGADAFVSKAADLDRLVEVMLTQGPTP